MTEPENGAQKDAEAADCGMHPESDDAGSAGDATRSATRAEWLSSKKLRIEL